MSVFIDSSALIALVNGDDHHHPRAVDALAEMARTPIALVTHEYALVETITLLQRRLGLPAVRQLIGGILPIIDVVWVDPEAHQIARDTMVAADRRGISLVDWTSFLVMRRADIDTAFTFDGDFAAQGFRVIPA